MQRTAKVYFVNPPFKSEYGKFSRENRSPAVTRSSTLYYPLWLIYAAALCGAGGISYLLSGMLPAKPMSHREAFDVVRGGQARILHFLWSAPAPLPSIMMWSLQLP